MTDSFAGFTPIGWYGGDAVTIVHPDGTVEVTAQFGGLFIEEPHGPVEP